MRLLLWDAVKERGLSPLQAQLLIYIRDHREDLCRTSQIAREFGLTPATVSDALSALEAKGLVRRATWVGDARVSTLHLTDAGSAMATDVDGWVTSLLESLGDLPLEQREGALLFLMRLIEGLQRRGIVTVARMCVTCRYFRPDAHPAEPAPHHCALLNKPLPVSGLRVDCPEYEPMTAHA